MRRFCYLALCLFLSSCGGVSEGGAGPVDSLLTALTPTGDSLRGTAAVGMALRNTEVKVRCPSTNRASYSVTVTEADPAIITVSDTTDLSKALIFDGQVITLASSGKLPMPLNGYQSYYIFNLKTTVTGSLTKFNFNLSDSPNGAKFLSTKGATQNGSHSLVPSGIIERKVTTDSGGNFEIDLGGAKQQTDYKSLTPCVLEIAPTGGAKLHSIALALVGVANITPLTDVLLATLIESNDLDTYFSTFNETAAIKLMQVANKSSIQIAWEKIKIGLIAGGFDVTAIGDSPITDTLKAATFVGATGNGYDKLLDAIALKADEIGNETLPYKKLLGGKQNMITLIKLDSHGVALKNQFGKWSDSGNERDGTRWDCVHDTANGVYWEVKRNDPNHFRHKGFTYTWFDSGALNGGSAGTELSGTCQRLPDSTKCNTENYVKAVNNARLCGFDKWELPDIESAKKFPMTTLSAVLANTEYFPDMQSGPLPGTSIWTRLPSANNAEGKYAWTFNVAKSIVEDGLKSSARPVRLVLPVKTLRITSIKEGDPPIGSPPVRPAEVMVLTNDALDAAVILKVGQVVSLRTTGYLPAPLSDSETYFVLNYSTGKSSFQLDKATTVTYTPEGCNLTTATECKSDLVSLTSPSQTLTVAEKDISTEGIVTSTPVVTQGIKNGDAVSLKIGDIARTVFITNFDPANSRYQLTDVRGGNPVSKAVLMMPKGDQFLVFAKPRAKNSAPKPDFCNPNVEATRDPVRYDNKVAGEVVDTVTNLVWQQCVYGLKGANCDEGTPEAMTFERAKTFVRDPVAQPDAWRLPNRKELASLVERKCTGVWQYAEAASGLWMSTRIFTQTGDWGQEPNWSSPVLVDSAGMAFSADGTNWHSKALSTDLFMGKVTSAGPPIQVANNIRITGESGYGWRDGIPPDPKDGIQSSDTTPTPLWMAEATFPPDPKKGVIWKTVLVEPKLGYEFSDSGSAWHSSPQSTDVYRRDGPQSIPVMIKGEKGGETNPGAATIMGVAFFRGNYPPAPAGGSYTSPTPDFPVISAKTNQAMVTGVAFYRGTLPPFTPFGGSFAYPAPTSPGWSDGIPKAITTNNVISAADSAQAINPKFFPQAIKGSYPQAIWTSDQVPNMDAAWIVNFYNGFEGYSDIYAPFTYIRLVKNRKSP